MKTFVLQKNPRSVFATQKIKNEKGHSLSERDADAARHLWERYYAQLIELARRHLRHARRRVADEEDVVLNVLDSFYRGAVAGRFPDLSDRDHLWRILVTLTERKAIDQMRHWGRRFPNAQGDSAFQGDDGSKTPNAIERVMGLEPAPEFAALVAEQCRELLSQLDAEQQRTIAEMRLDTCTVAEIPQHLQCSLTAVKRRLREIRRRWGARGGQSPA